MKVKRSLVFSIILMLIFSSISLYGRETEDISSKNTYRIVNVGADKDLNTYCNTGQAAARTNMSIWDYAENGDHYFQFISVGNKTFNIKSLSNSTELYLNIYGNTKSDIKSGSNVHLWGLTTSGMSDFQLHKLDNGNYLIMYDDNHSLVLGAKGSTKGSNVRIETYSDSPMQQWKLVNINGEDDEPTTEVISNPPVDTSEDVEETESKAEKFTKDIDDVAKTIKEISEDITIYDSTQLASVQTGISYRLVNAASNMDLNTYGDLGTAAKRTNISLWTYAENGDHYFQFKKESGKTYNIQSMSNSSKLFLNIYGDTQDDISSGSNIHLWSASTSGMNDFQLKQLENGNYIIMYEDNHSLVLTAQGEKAGSNVTIATYTESPRQQWQLVEAGSSVSTTVEVNYFPEGEPSEWAKEYISDLKKVGYLRESLYGNYTEKISRLNFTIMMVDLYEFITHEEIIKDSSIKFTDTNDTNVLKAVTVGIANGTGIGKFQPATGLNREEMANMFIRTIELSGIDLNDEPSEGFADDENISSWAKTKIYLAKSNGLLSGIGNNIFAPLFKVTNQEALSMVSKFTTSDKFIDAVGNDIIFPVDLNDPDKWKYGTYLSSKNSSGNYYGHYGFSYRAIDLNQDNFKDTGKNVRAVADGEIVYYSKADGWYIIKHSNPLKLTEYDYDSHTITDEETVNVWYSHYNHMANTSLKKGDYVSKGDLLGTVSNLSINYDNLGEHLHFHLTSTYFINSKGYSDSSYNKYAISPVWIREYRNFMLDDAGNPNSSSDSMLRIDTSSGFSIDGFNQKIMISLSEFEK